MKYFNHIQVFSSNQHGFRKGKSTEDALVTDLVYSSLNFNNKSTGYFFYFKRAFELVIHEIVLLKRKPQV